MNEKQERILRKLIEVMPENLRANWRFDASNIGNGYFSYYGLVSDEPHTSLGIDIRCRNDFRQDYFFHSPIMGDKKLGNVLAAYVAAANPAQVLGLLDEVRRLRANNKRLECANLDLIDGNAALREKLHDVSGRFMRCTYCGLRIDYDTSEEHQAAREEIHRHALICPEDPRTQEIERLRAALAPFAKVAEEFDPSDDPNSVWVDKARVKSDISGLTFRHFLNALVACGEPAKAELSQAQADIQQLRRALQTLMEFHPEDDLGPMTEDYWSPEYKAAMQYARRVLGTSIVS